MDKNENSKFSNIIPGIGTTFEEIKPGWQESNNKKISLLLAVIYLIVALSLSIFSLWAAGFGGFEAWRHRSIHVVLVLILIYYREFINSSGNKKIFDTILLILTLGVSSYIFFEYENIAMHRAGIPNIFDIYAMIILGLLVLEAARRIASIGITIIGLVLIGYTLFGSYIPGFFGHGGFSMKIITNQLFNTAGGFFGIPVGVASTYMIIFIIFGAFLIEAGIVNHFLKLATSLTGGMIGGPAKCAVVSSALIGTVTGSGPSNVAITGSFTIPLMKRLGYKAEFAAGVEAAASTGGIIMPPVMGATAFVLAQLTGTSYLEVCKAAVLPAILFYVAVFLTVHVEAIREGLKPLPQNEIPQFLKTLKEGWHSLIPLIALIYFIIIGRTPLMAGYAAILISMVFIIIGTVSKGEWKYLLGKFIRALEKGASGILTVSIACIASGMIMGLISITGIGVKLASAASSFEGFGILFVLFSVACASIILGMGVPAVATYIILAVTAGLALVRLGIPILSAHLFIFYFGIMSGLTPPVALTSYTAAAIAKSDLNKSAYIGFKLAISGFIVPFMFVMNPELLGVKGLLPWIMAGITALPGILALTFATQGWLISKLNLIQRVLLLISAYFLIEYGLITDIVGISILIMIALWQSHNKKKRSRNTSHII